MKYSLFISCPKGMEYLLENELTTLGLAITKVNPQGVFGKGSLETIYQLCLWSRLANRVHLILFEKAVKDEKDIYRESRAFPWDTMMDADKTLAVEFHGSSDAIRNSMFGAQVIKDGIVDYFRKACDQRPSVDKENPQIRIQAYLKRDILTVSLDLAGYSLHQRGYRRRAGPAPIKENVAAALLVRAKWPELCQQDYSLLDPFCGAGTIVIEAAMMAANIAPGLIRSDQAFQHWKDHQPAIWNQLKTAAQTQQKPVSIPLTGSDTDRGSLEFARINAEMAGVSDLIYWENKSIEQSMPNAPRGLFIANPPYGERLDSESDLIPVYQETGRLLSTQFMGWEASILTANPLLAKAIGLQSSRQYTIYNGALPCKLYNFSITDDNRWKGNQEKPLSSGAQMFANRLIKNLEKRRKWLKKNQISCYRLYDADLPEYAAAIDIYNEYAVLQEYAPPATIDPYKAEKRRLDMIQTLPQVLQISQSQVIVKERKRQKGNQQYTKIDAQQKTMVVTEGKAKLLVNLKDYLDTGLFLDHRPLRLTFANLEPGSTFLNCFCYTGTASVHAALAGAQTTNVDLSNTYLTWAQNNFRQNGLNISKHQFIEYDCLTWLRKTRDRFDTIFLDPPSFSNSKKTPETLDIQRDHVALIQAAMRVLNPGGVLYFSTNLRQFKLEPLLREKYTIRDISAQTIDLDFKDNPKIHQCFRVEMMTSAPSS